jgi:tetratricopeptide (TPR) repeat protein
MLRFIRRVHLPAAGLAAAVLISANASNIEARQIPTPSALEQEAAKFLQASDWSQTVAAYAKLVAIEANNPRAWLGLGVGLHETGKFAEALTAFAKAETLGYAPANQLRSRMARAHAKLGDATKAFTEIDRLAAAGFPNVAFLDHPDLAALKSDARFAAARDRLDRNARPCEFDQNFRKFDFWIGSWDVQPTGAPRAPVGASSVIEKSLNGCVIVENWAPPAGPAGKSFNIYNTNSKKWEQYWVDAGGRITHYFGEFRDDGNLYYEADQFGTTNKIRMTFFNQGPNQVRQLGHQSTDGGKTWTVTFDLTYVRKG